MNELENKTNELDLFTLNEEIQKRKSAIENSKENNFLQDLRNSLDNGIKLDKESDYINNVFKLSIEKSKDKIIREKILKNLSDFTINNEITQISEIENRMYCLKTSPYNSITINKIVTGWLKLGLLGEVGINVDDKIKQTALWYEECLDFLLVAQCKCGDREEVFSKMFLSIQYILKSLTNIFNINFKIICINLLNNIVKENNLLDFDVDNQLKEYCDKIINNLNEIEKYNSEHYGENWYDTYQDQELITIEK